MRDYIGDCIKEDNTCTDSLEIVLDNIIGHQQNLKCLKRDLNCYISFIITDFNLISNGSISLKLTEEESLCTAITVKIETTSSIPDQTSSYSVTLTSDRYKYFRGSTPSRFKFLMIPSLFEYDTDLTGYHVSLFQDPTEGSQVSFYK